MDFDKIISDGLAGYLTDDAVAELARRLAHSGNILRAAGNTADLASTGGPSSLSTLLGPLLLVRSGWKVPKLGVPGRPAGGIDVLSLIPGYRTDLDNDAALQILGSCGYVHLAAGPNHAPADGELFRLRQARHAQAVPSLAIASLLSKKLAMGVISLLLDARVASLGNFGADFDEAQDHARRFCRVAKAVGINAACVLTDASSPYQLFVGRSEALLALADLFSGRADEWLCSHAEECANWIEATLGFADALRPQPSDLRSIFMANLDAQGASAAGFAVAAERARATERFVVYATDDGSASYDLRLLREALLADQGVSANGYSDGAGAILHARPGQPIRPGDAMLSVRLTSGGWNRRRSAYQACIGYEGCPARQSEIVCE